VAAITSAAAATSSIGLSSSAAGGTSSAVGTTLPSHDPRGPGFMFLQPPVVPSYPSFTTAFAQSIADVVGRSRKSKSISVLHEFNMSSHNV
jgi:hypothetical protein